MFSSSLTGSGAVSRIFEVTKPTGDMAGGTLHLVTLKTDSFGVPRAEHQVVDTSPRQLGGLSAREASEPGYRWHGDSIVLNPSSESHYPKGMPTVDIRYDQRPVEFPFKWPKESLVQRLLNFLKRVL